MSSRFSVNALNPKMRRELWQDLVLHGIRKSTFQHLRVNWSFNVLAMAFKTFLFVQGLSKTPAWQVQD